MWKTYHYHHHHVRANMHTPGSMYNEHVCGSPFCFEADGGRGASKVGSKLKASFLALTLLRPKKHKLSCTHTSLLFSDFSPSLKLPINALPFLLFSKGVTCLFQHGQPWNLGVYDMPLPIIPIVSFPMPEAGINDMPDIVNVIKWRFASMINVVKCMCTQVHDKINYIQQTWWGNSNGNFFSFLFPRFNSLFLA